MAWNKKTEIIGAAILGGFLLAPAEGGAYAVSPIEIYMQAREGNYDYFNRLARYRNAINMQDATGNTAYCFALRYKDTAAQEMLAGYGANTAHPCVKKLQEEQAAQAERAQRAAQYRRRSGFSGSRYADDGNNYLWWGVGALAVGGGIAALASSGGGGSGDGSSGGNSGGNSGAKLDKEPTIDANIFKTEEYKSGNLLPGMNAAEAYSYMYTQDEEGVLHSHQANSDEALEKVRVGLIDTGVANNRDLAGKIVKSYDINKYNDIGNIRGHFEGNLETYIFYMPDAESGDGDYYFLQVDSSDATYPIPVSVDVAGVGLTESQLNEVLAAYGLSQSDF